MMSVQAAAGLHMVHIEVQHTGIAGQVAYLAKNSIVAAVVELLVEAAELAGLRDMVD